MNIADCCCKNIGKELRYIMILRNWKEKTSKKKSISSQVVSPASPTVLQENKKEPMTIDISGQKCLESLKKSNPPSLLQKMSEVLLTSKTAWFSRQCALIWKVKASKSKRLLFQLQASARPTKETESGLWATPNTMDHLPPRSKEGTMKLMQGHRKGRTRPSNLREQVDPETMRLWRTPDAHCDRGASSEKRMKMKLEKKMPISLNDQVRHEKLLWPTPTTQEIEHPNMKLTKTGRRLTKDRKNSHSLNLADTVKLWPTPRANKVIPRITDKNREKLANRNKSNLEEEVAGYCGQATGSLNPMWVEWLMGYPGGYTDLKHWETLSSHKSQKK